ncbi:hypothetical protein COLO4_15682 [Corchorus olitorius]|uniref:Uncharacterized protein n=1 Tax=Corchorus olitorius TaxID=93759 RepID=A0A1R3JLR6_9ROSI|nr:hypothetical protein COLO4_15682 [Corchorus olitorius]
MEGKKEERKNKKEGVTHLGNSPNRKGSRIRNLRAFIVSPLLFLLKISRVHQLWGVGLEFGFVEISCGVLIEKPLESLAGVWWSFTGCFHRCGKLKVSGIIGLGFSLKIGGISREEIGRDLGERPLLESTGLLSSVTAVERS